MYTQLTAIIMLSLCKPSWHVVDPNGKSQHEIHIQNILVQKQI